MRNENCVGISPIGRKFDPKVFLRNKKYCLCDDFSRILRRSKTTNYHQVPFDYWDIKKDLNGDKTIRPFEFSDLCLIYDLIEKQTNGKKGKLIVKNKLFNVFSIENGLSSFVLLACFRRTQWCIGSYVFKELKDYKTGFRIFSKKIN